MITHARTRAHMLARARPPAGRHVHTCSHMSTHHHACSRLITRLHASSCLLTHDHTSSHMLTPVRNCSHMCTHACTCSHVLYMHARFPFPAPTGFWFGSGMLCFAMVFEGFAPKGFHNTKTPPRGPQEAPKRPPRGRQEAPKRPQEVPKRLPRGPQEALERPQEAPRGPPGPPKFAHARTCSHMSTQCCTSSHMF